MKNNQEIEKSIITKFRKTIWHQFVKGISDYQMIKEHDSIAVCISGGKDSFLLAKCMQELHLHGKVPFDLKFIVMDPGYKQDNLDKIINNAKLLNIPINIFKSNIFNVAETLNGKSPCYMCARMRRGALYSKAKELGCNKIALGHHFDDVIETILISTFYAGEFKTMMPKLHSTNYRGMELIRPLYLVKEEDIIKWRDYNSLEFLNCACKYTERQKEISTSKRKEIKELINKLRQKSKFIDSNIFKSVTNVNLTTLIGYHDDTEEYNF